MWCLEIKAIYYEFLQVFLNRANMLNLTYEWPLQVSVLLWSNLVYVYQPSVIGEDVYSIWILFHVCMETVAKHFIVCSLQKKHNSIALSCL